MTTYYASAVFMDDTHTGIQGYAQFTQVKNADTSIKIKVVGVTPGFHGIHIHAYGDQTNGCASAGSHYNEEGKNHGSPLESDRHVGDLGNINVNGRGEGTLNMVSDKIHIYGTINNVVGRSIVLHAKPDDLGQGTHSTSQTTGNAGARIACGVIGHSKAHDGEPAFMKKAIGNITGLGPLKSVFKAYETPAILVAAILLSQMWYGPPALAHNGWQKWV